MNQLSPHVVSVVEKMMQCREPKQMGYQKYQCPDHPEKIRVVPHSCKTSICTTCAAIQNDIWSEQIKNIFPVVPYLHITFTMPKEFREFFGCEDVDWKRKDALYNLAWQTIKGFCNQKNIRTGCFSTIHTFGRDLKINPHVHLIMPAGGLVLSEQGKHAWQKIDHLPQEYLRKAWKFNLLRYVLENTPNLQQYTEQIMHLVQSRHSEDYMRLIKLLRQITHTEGDYEKWSKVCSVKYYVNVGQKQPYQQTVNYAVRYNRRLPIAKSRILDFSEEEATITWRYHAHNEPTPTTSIIPAFLFIDKLIQHIKPKGFRTVRYHGIFSQRNLNEFKPILQKLLRFNVPQEVPTWRERQLEYTGEDPLICPCCHKNMHLIEKAYLNPDGNLKIIPIKKDA